MYRYDLSLEQKEGKRFLSLILTMMIFLCSFAFSAWLLIQQASNEWRAQLDTRITIEIPPNSHATDEILTKLDELKQVKQANVLSQDELQNIMQNWTGGEANIGNLPLPTLIDVFVWEDKHRSKLLTFLQETYPKIIIDDHQEWISDFIHFLSFWEIGLLIFTSVMIILAVTIIVHLTKSWLSIHRDEIDLLHQMGAKDNYITKQFQHYAFARMVKSAFCGSLLSLGLLFLYVSQFSMAGTSLLPSFSLTMTQWMFLGISPIVIGCMVTFITTRMIALKELKQAV